MEGKPHRRLYAIAILAALRDACTPVTSVVGGLGATEKNAVTVTPSRGEKGTLIGRILTGQAFAGIAVALQNCDTLLSPLPMRPPTRNL